MNKRIDALIGAIAGDIIGSPYEFNGLTDVARFKPFGMHSRYTDDTVLSVAVAEWLSNPGTPLQDYLVRYAKTYYWVGYGGMFLRWSRKRNPQPYNSFGNGSAMRVSAVGCWANDVEEAMQLAEESALPTHNHPEGIKGAQAIAVAVVLARQGKSKEEIKTELLRLFDYDLNLSYEDLLKKGYAFHVTCQETVPPALVCFFDSNSYEECIVKAMLTNKDTDTAAAVAGAVAGAFYGIPETIREEALAHLPKELKAVIDNFEALLTKEA